VQVEEGGIAGGCGAREGFLNLDLEMFGWFRRRYGKDWGLREEKKMGCEVWFRLLKMKIRWVAALKLW
jgi:hypothetical protein